MPRKISKIKANKTILLVVEGPTEKIYFLDVKASLHIPGVTVTPKLSKHSDLNTILTTALTELDSGAYDSVWCIFDRDTIVAKGMSKELQQLYETAKLQGIHFADSMPAFEVWFLLHYAIPKMYYKSQDGVIDELKKYIPDYSKNQKWLSSAKLYSMLTPRFNNALINTEILNKRRDDSNNRATTFCNIKQLFEELFKNIEKKRSKSIFY